MSRVTAASKEAWSFSAVEEFWARFSPLSPYGKDMKALRLVLSDAGEIEKRYDETEAVAKFLKRKAADSSVRDRVSYHLKRIPRLPEGVRGSGERYELIELFQIKKFIANYRAILGLLDPELREAFGLRFESEGLRDRLLLGGSDPETFFISDAYDERLADLRAEIGGIDRELFELRRGALEALRTEYGLDFAGRDFLVVPANSAKGDFIGSEALFVEAYDRASFIVRPKPGKKELDLEAERSAAAEREKSVEEEVLAGLSRLAAEEIPRLSSYASSLAAFDLALARELLVEVLGLSRPVLSAASAAGAGEAPPALRLDKGRYLPCQWACERLGLRYQSLDVSLREPAAAIFGSNMGGKTVALKTLVFFQILAQAGFFVPAARFETGVYARIHYVGELSEGAGSGEESAGLSGFGFEIRSFVDAVGERSGSLFAVFDEFARTTSSEEAEAILSAALERLAREPGCRTVFSTHFKGIERIAGVGYLRMKGLDRDAARLAMAEADEAIGDRIRRINGMMEYTLVADDGPGPDGSDAVLIASLLGLDARIVDRAAELYEQGRKKLSDINSGEK
jgi:DNA mismatch repair protein MutS2